VLLHNYQPLTYGHCWRSRVSQCSVVSLSQVHVRVRNVERRGIVADTRRARVGGHSRKEQRVLIGTQTQIVLTPVELDWTLTQTLLHGNQALNCKLSNNLKA
jgi:hypothetical protein